MTRCVYRYGYNYNTSTGFLVGHSVFVMYTYLYKLLRMSLLLVQYFYLLLAHTRIAYRYCRYTSMVQIECTCMLTNNRESYEYMYSTSLHARVPVLYKYLYSLGLMAHTWMTWMYLQIHTSILGMDPICNSICRKECG